MEDRGIEILEQVSASRKLGEDHARELIRGAARIHVAKGKKLDVFEGGTVSDEIVTKMLGSTGNLRAPTVRVGDQLLVGFNEETYRDVLGD
jgi:hypothetical protein